MHGPYCCPNCKTNRTRFNIIRQMPQAVKMDPRTGEVVDVLADAEPNPLHLAYRGPEYRVQCAVCGLIEDERTFLKFGEHQ
ncbi:hypothetical protein [Heyndrickxia acidiproducens]|uniref:hypothetical protein n=1 Tax=Heyndrickxia acidiproducens TaxID=1121084 RepID=UPI000379BD15|nr:hypothetical protein [Heyndrickxia acidiproducens]